MDSLMGVLQGVHLKDCEDAWSWRWSKSGNFTVRSMYKECFSFESPVDQAINIFPVEVVWEKPLPLKIRFFYWTAVLERNLTSVNLIRRGKQLSPVCSRCKCFNEDTSHLFLHCAFSLEVWHTLMMPKEEHYALIMTVDSLEEWLIAWPPGPSSEFGGLLWEFLPYATGWVLWKWRNKGIFQQKMWNLQEIAKEIKGVLWYWGGAWSVRQKYRFQDLLLCWDDLFLVFLIKNSKGSQ
ncbi:hypothetical protein FRX31_026886 [Thalictrum thalictroides]|uniref:Reverse transcriptase zinc-binding domain-containing protein n=1 Tax=Thalictrum thalictroides TaxID=46969 RepID=A0A7J6VH76_THATH|nr:hypothetical protein FRX31_026886 [Thalictrum thalictroides]